MADRLEEIVTVLLSVFSSIMMIMSMLGEILTSLLVQQQTQQNLLIAQSAIKENHFMLKAKRKWSVRRKVRSCWKKPGRTEQWWTNLWQGYNSGRPIYGIFLRKSGMLTFAWLGETL